MKTRTHKSLHSPKTKSILEIHKFSYHLITLFTPWESANGASTIIALLARSIWKFMFASCENIKFCAIQPRPLKKWERSKVEQQKFLLYLAAPHFSLFPSSHATAHTTNTKYSQLFAAWLERDDGKLWRILLGSFPPQLISGQTHPYLCHPLTLFIFRLQLAHEFKWILLVILIDTQRNFLSLVETPGNGSFEHSFRSFCERASAKSFAISNWRAGVGKMFFRFVWEKRAGLNGMKWI